MIVIGIDFGKNIGLAFCYKELSIAMPYCTVKSVAEAGQKIKEKNAQLLVVGLPLLLNGTQGDQCKITHSMLNELLNLTPLEYHFQDERFSSKFSSGKYKTSFDHERSAVWILQTFLDSNKNKIA